MRIQKQRIYHGIDHPSVAKVECPFCFEPKGTPCRRRFAPFGTYTETHTARVKAYEKLINPIKKE